MNQEAVGKLIKEIRVKNKLTQNEFAKELGVTYQAVSKWENGKNLPDVSSLKIICDKYNYDLSEMLGSKKKKSKLIYIILGIVLILIVLLAIFFILKNNNDSFEFKTIGTTCSEFTLTGSAAYDENKSSIYISNIDYCGKEDKTEYKNITCTLYENYDGKTSKISSCKSKNNITLEKYLASAKVNVENYKSMCKKFNKSNMYLEINAVNDKNQTILYKIPISLKDNC